MSITIDDKVTRWTAKCKSALVIEIIQGKTTVSEARDGIRNYLIFYNSKRPHSSLDRKTPDQVYFNQMRPMNIAA